MASYNKPTENLAQFNNTVFTDANNDTLSLSEAKTLFLGRTGQPTSVATLTTFTGDITSNSVNVGGLILSAGGSGNSAYFSTYTTSRLRAINIGASTSVTDDATCIGYSASAGGNYSVAIGRSAGAGGGSSVAVGYNTSAGGASSTAIGAGASTSVANEIVLGTATETVNCVGTTSSISLKTAKNLSINGTIFGVGAAASNALFCGLTNGTGNGSGNTLYGSGSYANSSDGSSYRNTIVGSLTMTNTNSSYSDTVVVGNGCANTGTLANTANKITLLGCTTSAANIESTALGYGATATLANQIMLGRNTETVYCPGTASSTSLIATKNISVNGIQVGIGSEVLGNANIYIGVGSGGSGSANTLIGRNSWTPNGVSGNSGNTIVGTQNGFNLNLLASVSNNTVIGYNSYNSPSQVAYNNICSIGVNNVVGGNQTSLLGTSTTASGDNSTAVGYGANATLGNQIKLGTSTEFVECAGTSTTNGCLKLNGGLKLQTAYGAVPTSTMLGYRIELASITISSLTTGTSQTLGSLALSVGVWSLNFTFELLATGALTETTQQSFFFSNASGASATYATRINNTGTLKLHGLNYLNAETPAYSGGGTYYASAAITLYPAINITFTTGALSGTGWASAVRIG